MIDYRNPRSSKGQVARLARTYHRKFANSFGASLEVEDLEQEFWIVWHTVSQRFDPERGFSFEAMLAVSIRNRAIELAKFHARRHKVTRTHSIFDSPKGVEDVQMVDILPSDCETGEETVIRKERANFVLKNVDHRLRAMVEALQNPPEILRREIEAMHAKAEYAAERGIETAMPKELNLGLLTEMFGLSRCSRYRLLDEMKDVMRNYD